MDKFLKSTDKLGWLGLHPSYRATMGRLAKFIVLLALIQFVAWLVPATPSATGITAYLPLHVLLETISIVISMLVFTVGWNSRDHRQSGNVILLACVFFSVALLDFLHTVSYGGMPDFLTHNDAQKHLYFWLSARALAACAILAIIIRPWRTVLSSAMRYLVFGVALLGVMLISSLVWQYQAWLPDMFIPGVGLTALKKNLEYGIVLINVLTALLLWRKMRQPQPYNAVLLFGAVCVMAMSEFFFTLYTTMTGSYNVLGHIYKAIAYLLIYRAIVVEVIEEPYNRLAESQRDLAMSLRATSTGLWHWDVATNVTHYSEEWKAQLGYLPNELPDTFSTWESLLHPDDRDSAKQFVRDFVVSKQLNYESEFRMHHRDGSYRWILARGEMQFDSAGEATRLIGTHIDITERKQAETDLQLTQYALDHAPDAVYWMKPDGRFIYVNEVACRTLGYTREELLAMSVADIDPSVPHGVSPEMTQRTERTGSSLVETLHRTKSGHIFPVEINVAFISYGGEDYHCAFVRDITERRLMETAQQKSNELLRSVIENSPIRVFWKDRESYFLGCNSLFARDAGLNGPEELIGRSDFEMGWKAQAELYIADDQVVMESGNSKLGYEESQTTPDGETIWLRTSKVPLYDADHQCIGILGVYEDITERKQAESAIRLASQRLQVALEGSQISVWEIDAITKEVWLDENWATYLGDRTAETHTTFSELLTAVHPDDRQHIIDASIQTLKGQTERYFVEHRMRSMNGDWEWVSSRGKVSERDASGRALRLIGTNTNITERKRIEDEIKSLNTMLEQRVSERTVQLQRANQAKDSFLASMSHEIRTPLAGLLGMMELLSLSMLGKEQNKMLVAAQNSGKSLLRIVNDILDWSKIEAGKMEIAPQVASIGELLKEVATTYGQVASAKDIRFSISIDDNISAAHRFDTLRLSQILNNFTSNAIKFSERGNVELRAELVTRENGNEVVRLCVADHGIGISPEQQRRLFQHYEQGSSDTARMYGGTGLGLAICLSLAELMRGELSVESSLGSGSTFCIIVSLPVASVAEQRELMQGLENHGGQSADVGPLVSTTNPIQLSVLVVDDHPVNRMLLQQQLECMGIQADIEAYAIVALAHWQEKQYDLLITDCHMPEMDGYELTRNIRELERQSGAARIPIIAWTANVLADEAERCNAAGMDDLLTKPTDLRALRAMLLKWLPQLDITVTQVGVGKMKQGVMEQVLNIEVLQHFVTNRSDQIEVLNMFVEQTRMDIVELRANLQAGDALASGQTAHRIKGACRMVGALALASLCERIEKAAKQGELGAARDLAGAALDQGIEGVALFRV